MELSKSKFGGADMTSDYQHYQSKQTIRGAFHLTPESIRTIAKICSEFTDKPAYVKFKFEGDDSLVITEFQDNLDHPSLRYFNINEIIIRSDHWKDGKKRELFFMAWQSSYGPSFCHIQITGNLDTVNSAKIKLNEEIRCISTPYSWLYGEYGPAIEGGAAGMLGNFLVMYFFNLAKVWSEITSGSYTNATTVILLFIMFSFAFRYFISITRGYLFPSFVVDIGAGNSKIQATKNYRNIVFVAVIIGLFVSVLGSYIYAKIEHFQTNQMDHETNKN